VKERRGGEETKGRRGQSGSRDNNARVVRHCLLSMSPYRPPIQPRPKIPCSPLLRPILCTVLPSSLSPPYMDPPSPRPHPSAFLKTDMSTHYSEPRHTLDLSPRSPSHPFSARSRAASPLRARLSSPACAHRSIAPASRQLSCRCILDVLALDVVARREAHRTHPKSEGKGRSGLGRQGTRRAGGQNGHTILEGG
jgi:hypothetical protein